MHPDLHQRIASYIYRHLNFPTISGPKDYIGHGTHVAGTIAALINNDVGINGICACQLHIWKIFDDKPDFQPWSNDYGYWVDVMYRRALADCLDEGVNVINLSIGGPAEPGPDEEILFEQLLAAGTRVVAAMGDEREDGSPISYPAAIPGVIAVGATNITDRVTRFSNRGEHISLSAPGQTIWSTLPTYAGQTGFRADFDAAGRPRTAAGFTRHRLRRMGWHIDGFASRGRGCRSAARKGGRDGTRGCAGPAACDRRSRSRHGNEEGAS